MRSPTDVRGAAMIMALLVVVLVTTLTTTVAWRAWQQTEQESAQRFRAQAQAILRPAITWARVILRQDARLSSADHLGEGWALQLAPARLSTLLSTERSSTLIDESRALLGGRISDAQGRLNIANLVQGDGTPSTAWRLVLERLYRALGLQQGRVLALQQALLAATRAAASGAGSAAGNAPLLPHSLAQLAWLGASGEEIMRLTPYVVILPEPTPLNVNTAPLLVLQALFGEDGAGIAQQLFERQRRAYFRDMDAVRDVLGDSPEAIEWAAHVDIRSDYFLAYGQLDIEQRSLTQQALIRRSGTSVSLVALQSNVLTDQFSRGDVSP